MKGEQVALREERVKFLMEFTIITRGTRIMNPVLKGVQFGAPPPGDIEIFL